MLLRTLLLAAFAALAWPSPADAQIYVWRDARGNLVLSDRRLDAGAVTYAVPNAPAHRSTRPAASSTVRDRFEPFVQEHAAKHSLRPDLVRAVYPGRIGLQPARDLAKGRDGPYAIDAGHCPPAWRTQRVRPG